MDVCLGLEDGGKRRMTASGYRVYFEGERSVLKLGCSDIQL